MARAAHRLAVSQPAVSKSIADLEHTLGIRLVDRSPQGVEPTLYGRALARRGAAAFDEQITWRAILSAPYGIRTRVTALRGRVIIR
jgi:DNA-binding transcriptional LysR family regulator